MSTRLSVNHLPDTSMSTFFKRMGADEIILSNYTPNAVSVREMVVRFGNRYMKVCLDYWTMHALVFGPSSYLKELETEVQEFLLTGKNEFFPDSKP